MGDRSYAIDANLIVADGAAAVAASGVSQVGGVDVVLDLGGNQGVTPVQQARIDAMLVIYVTAITTAAGDELYRLIVQGSNDPAFGEDNVQNLASIDFGNEAVRDGAGTTLTTAAPPGTGNYPAGSMYELPFVTEQNNVKYEYMRVYQQLSGAAPSITWNGFVAVLPESC